MTIEMAIDVDYWNGNNYGKPWHMRQHRIYKFKIGIVIEITNEMEYCHGLLKCQKWQNTMAQSVKPATDIDDWNDYWNGWLELAIEIDEWNDKCWPKPWCIR